MWSNGSGNPTSPRAPGGGGAPAQLGMPEAAHHVVVDHAGGLHVGVADGGAHELEAAGLEVLAHGVGQRVPGRDLPRAEPAVVPRPSFHEPPDIAVEAAELGL